MNAPRPFLPADLTGPRRPCVLVVDDEPINIQALYQVFAADCQVLMATHGEQALALCRERHPDLVLLDVLMPGLDGLEVCRLLQAESATQDIPVIFVTARSDPDAETRGLEAGAVDFIAKPFNPTIVRARVRTHLTLKLQSDLLRQMVFIDGLTAVHNRRFFDDRLEAEWGRAMRNRSSLSLLMIDVDHFKAFNDRHGHQGGDQRLRVVADVLRRCIRRSSDIIARYGGEEFACILPESDPDAVMLLARMILERVRELTPAFLVIDSIQTVYRPDLHQALADRVRALVDDSAKPVREATPSVPVEVLGFNGTPEAGDSFVLARTPARSTPRRSARSRRATARRRSRSAAAARSRSRAISRPIWGWMRC